MSIDARKLTPAVTAMDEAAATAVNAMKAIRKHWPMLVACIVVATGGALVYSKSLPRVYESQVMIELDPSATRPLGDKMDTVMPLGPGEFIENREYYETQYKIITSSKVLEAAARDVGLANEYTFFGLKAPPATPLTVTQAGATLRTHVTVEPVRNSRLVLIKVDDTVPARAKKIADAVGNAYMALNLEKAISATSDSVVWLNGQVDSVKKDLEINENALHEFKQQNDLPSTSLNESSNMIRQEMLDLDTALTRTRTRKQELLARHAELSKVASDSADILPASELLSSEFLQRMRSEYQEALRARSSLLAEGKGPNHPLVKAADGKVNEAKAALLAEVKNIQGAVERDLAVVNREEAGEAGLYEAAHRRAVDLNMKEIEYHRLDRSRDQNEKLYAMLLEHMKEADLARMMKVNNIHLVEAAIVPGMPIFPRTGYNMFLGGVLGLFLGLGLVWLRESLDSSLKTPEDVERVLGITFLGLLPAIEDGTKSPMYYTQKRKRLARRMALDPNGRPELIVHDRPVSGIAEAARSIRTNLMFTNPDRPYRKLLVTSAAPSEGKTTIACSIAIALAQSGQRTCIIDCDLRRPRLHRIFDRTGDQGVTNVLVGEATLEEVARPTVVENLFSIPAGPIPPNPADLLHSDRFKKFLEDAGKTFDRVVIDSPPLIAVTDSAIISTLVDGTMLVLRAFRTTRAVSRQGLRTLADVDAPVVGAVLNAVDLTRHEYAYFQYYYYKKEGYAPLPTSKGDGGDDASNEGQGPQDFAG